jgi:hypothetical protein
MKTKVSDGRYLLRSLDRVSWSKAIFLIFMTPCGSASMEHCYSLLAENAAVMPDGRYFVFKGGIEVLHCPSVPCVIPSLALVVRVGIAPSERGAPHVVQLEGFRPNNEHFTPVMINRMEPITDSTPPDRSVYHTFIINFSGVVIQELGLHRFKIIGDGAELGDITFHADPLPAS